MIDQEGIQMSKLIQKPDGKKLRRDNSRRRSAAINGCSRPAHFQRARYHARNFWLLLLGFIFTWAVVLGRSPLMANSKIDLLQQKIADLQLLDNELEHQISLASELKSKLVERSRTIEQELLDLNRLLKLRSFQEVLQKPRFSYDLKLLKILYAYIDALEKKIDFYQVGRDKVAFLLQLAEDDVRMLATLNDLRIDALTTQISLIINKYLSEAHAIVIAPDDLQPYSARAIWEKINPKRVTG